VQNEDDRMRTLSDALRAVATDDAGLAPSCGVKTRLVEEVRSIGRARRRRMTVVTLAAAAAVAAIALAVPWRRAVDRPAPSPRLPAELVTQFFPLTYSNLPVSNAQLIRVRVPHSALESFGLAPLDIPAAGAPGGERATVPADVLVGEDGVARAIRFVKTN
jgi:hypothetical protein